jgi:hypothetical protein
MFDDESGHLPPLLVRLVRQASPSPDLHGRTDHGERDGNVAGDLLAGHGDHRLADLEAKRGAWEQYENISAARAKLLSGLGPVLGSLPLVVRKSS